MKNKILVFIFSLLLAGATQAQEGGRIGTHDAIGKWNSATPSSAFTTVSEGRNLAQEILDIVGLKANFEILQANIPNAAAVVYGGKRYILYNPNFMRELEKKTGTKWAGVSVLAHEIGHHLNGHTMISSGSQPALELESDEFSGFVLRKMGASLTEAQAAMKTLASSRATRTHPGQYDRLTAISDGWNRAEGQLTGKETVKRNVGQRPQATISSNAKKSSAPNIPVIDKYIIGDVSFHADASTEYYVTEQFNLVQVKNNRISIIGKITSLNSKRFPYLIYDKANTQLLVDSYGNIITKDGQRVGSLSARKA